jgi:PAS domain S-box-containing protein
MKRAKGMGDDERELLFKQIARSKQEWQATFDSITDLIHIRDKEQKIIKANRAFAQYFGLDPKGVINKRCEDLPCEGNVFPISCYVKKPSKDDQPDAEEIRDPDSNKTFRILTFPYFSFEGDFAGTVHIARDITEEREQEMRLIMSERLASLGQMASGIAHEINNPLASIAGCAEGLLNRIKKDQLDKDIFEGYLKIIEEEIARCKKITTGMLSFVRKTTYDKKEVRINRILDRTLEVIGFQGRLKNVEVIKEFSDEMPVIIGSEGELRQVFMTIIINALDAMNDKGMLELSTDVAHGQAFISIRDQGSGISPEDISRIFTPFFTTRAETGGIGLGLSIARKIIADHNGEIDVTSDIDEGTTFQIKLPC